MRRILAAAVMAVAVAVTTGCASEPPPVSEKVQKYYDEQVANAKPTLPNAVSKKVAFIGDSYTAGSGAANKLQRWTTNVVGKMGWEEVNLAGGGTGYVNPGTTANYSEAIQKAKEAKPDMVIVSGGRNDTGYPAATLGPAIADFFSSLHAELPAARIIVVSPVFDDDPAPASLARVTDAVKAGAENVGATYLDIGQPLLGHPEMIYTDGTHPNDAGHAAIAKAVEEKLRAANVE